MTDQLVQAGRNVPSGESELLMAVISLSKRLDLTEVLERLVRAATELTGAPCAAINVLDGRGVDNRFITYGADPAMAEALRTFRHADALTARVPAHEPLILDEIPASLERLATEGGAKVDSFMAVSVRVRHMVFAHLYLVNKEGGFTKSDGELMAALATAVGVAIENAQLYRAAQGREDWLSAGQEITTMLLSGAEEEEALSVIARRAREVARACTCVLVLPSVRTVWARPSSGIRVPISPPASSPSAISITNWPPTEGRTRTHVHARATSLARRAMTDRASSSSAPDRSMVVISWPAASQSSRPWAAR
jgi:transcriptional regulator with GAF, ATPase, and Fis domain